MTLTNDQWLDLCAIHLVARGAGSAEAGQILAEVRTHLADSGEQAQDAFGDPSDYAQAVPISPVRSRFSSYLLLVLSPLCVLWVIWTVDGASGLLTGQQVSYSYLDMAAGLLGGLGAVVGVSILQRRPEIPMFGGGILIGALVGMIVLTLIGAPAAFTVPAGWALGVGLALGLGWLAILIGGRRAPITDPLTGAATDPHGRPAAKSTWLLVIFAVLVLLVICLSWYLKSRT